MNGGKMVMAVTELLRWHDDSAAQTASGITGTFCAAWQGKRDALLSRRGDFTPTVPANQN
jgi:hypothetical protein